MPVAEKQQTTIAFGQAEPGRDIFAGEPVREIKSEPGVPDVPAPPAEEKVVSPAFTQTAEELLVDRKQVVEVAGNAVGSSTSESASSVADAELHIQTSPATLSKEEPQGIKEPEGPLDQVAAEADRVAKDLYPEAHE